MPERRGELEFSLQPMVKRPSFRFALLLPNEIGAHRDFIFSCFTMSVGHLHFLSVTIINAKEANYSMILTGVVSRPFITPL